MRQARAAENIQPLLEAIRRSGVQGAVEEQAKLYLRYFETLIRKLRMPDNLQGYGPEDVVQESFFQSIADLRAGKIRDDSAFPGYWQRTAQNLINNLRRKSRQRSGNRYKLFHKFYDRKSEDGERILIDRELVELVKEILNTLSEQCRRILRLDALDYSAAEIADQTSYANAKTIGVTKFRCMNRLRKIIADRKIKDPRDE